MRLLNRLQSQRQSNPIRHDDAVALIQAAESTPLNDVDRATLHALVHDGQSQFDSEHTRNKLVALLACPNVAVLAEAQRAEANDGVVQASEGAHLVALAGQTPGQQFTLASVMIGSRMSPDARRSLSAQLPHASEMVDAVSSSVDRGMGEALASLAGKDPIDSQQWSKALVAGTSDLDNRAATVEYDDARAFMGKHFSRFANDAGGRMLVYAEVASQRRAQGKSGIPSGVLAPKLDASPYQDATMSLALADALMRPGVVDAKAFTAALYAGTKDPDSRAAGVEYDDARTFVSRNGGRLSEPATASMVVYAEHASAARAKGKTSLDADKLQDALQASPYQDASMGLALADLLMQPGPISKDALVDAIAKGAADQDGRAAGPELDDVMACVQRNQHRFSEDAMGAVVVYAAAAGRARQQGRGLSLQKLVDAMRTSPLQDASVGQAMAELLLTPSPIGKDALLDALQTGMGDQDGRGATAEFDDVVHVLQQFGDRFSDDAKCALGVLAEHASNARGRGRTGLNTRAVVDAMRHAPYQDASMTAALSDLLMTPGTLTKQQLVDAVAQGASDKDGRGATAEFDDVLTCLQRNTSRFAPDAVAAIVGYAAVAGEARARGRTGANTTAVVDAMTRSTLQDASLALAMAGRLVQPTKVTGADLADVVRQGASDQDGRAATVEFDDTATVMQTFASRFADDAQAALVVFAEQASAARAAGRSGLDVGKLADSMAQSPYRDASMSKALSTLVMQPGVLSQTAFVDAVVGGWKDQDGQATKTEFDDVTAFVQRNRSRLSPGALAAYDAYAQTVDDVQTRGLRFSTSSTVKAMRDASEAA